MRARYLLVVLAFSLAGCVRSPPSPPSPPTEGDRSIVFPQFFERPAIEIGAGGTPYELDGVVLRALTVAIRDFLPSDGKKKPCWDRPEAHRYRIIRQGDIIFIRIDDDLEACGLQYVSLDSGAKYAISTEGRILRRVLDGEPEELLAPEPPDAGEPKGLTTPEASPKLAPSQGMPMDLQPPRTPGGENGPVPPAMPPVSPYAPDGGTPDGDAPDGPSRAG
jgi:hypothetical protein